MPIKLKCRCGEKLSAPDSMAGKQGKCPRCGMRFLVPQSVAVGPAAPTTTVPAAGAAQSPPASPAPDFDDFPDLDDDIPGLMEEQPAPLRPAPSAALPMAEMKRKAEESRATRASLEKVATGITLVFWGALGAFLSFAILSLSAYLHHLGGPLPTYRVAFLAKLMLCASWGASMAGHLMCALVPPRVGGKPLVLFAAAVDTAAMVVATLGLARMISVWPTFAASGICLFVGSLAFVVFLKRVAALVKRADFERDIKISLIALALCLVASGICVVVPALGALVFLLVGPFGMYKYLYLLQHMAEAVRS